MLISIKKKKRLAPCSTCALPALRDEDYSRMNVAEDKLTKPAVMRDYRRLSQTSGGGNNEKRK